MKLPNLIGRLKRLKRFRSAITGRWVSRRYAAEHPDTTVSENDKGSP